MKKLLSILCLIPLVVIGQPTISSPSAGIFNNFTAAAGASNPSFGAEIVRGSDSTAATTFTVAIGALAAGKALILSVNTSASAATVSGVTDPRGNTYTVRQIETAACGSGMSAAIVSAIITTPLQAGDVLTVTLNSATGTRLYQAMYVNNATAIDISKKSASCNSTPVSSPSAVVANSVQLGFVSHVGGTSPAYSGSSWSTVGANQSSGAVGIMTYVQTTTVGAGTADPGGTFGSNVQWEAMWVSIK